MKKIFLILTLFFVFCLSIFASPADFFKSYPNGSIEIKIDWDKGEGYYGANFYDGKNNKVKAKKNWGKFGDINSFQEFYNTLKNEYSNQKIKVLINITNEEHPIGMFLNAKFYNSKGALIREANNDRFYHRTSLYDGNGKLINETENNIQQNEFIFKEYGKNSKLLNETYISFDYNQIGVKAYNNNNILIMESSYTIKNLDFDNVKIIMSNLFKNANYQNVLDGYEKFYDDNGNLELENIYFTYKGNDKYTLNNINLDVKEGETLGIIGESGSGKTTLLLSILGLLSSEGSYLGNIYFNNQLLDKEHKFKEVHFNTNVLRAETAAIYSIAAAQVIMEEKGGCKKN